MNHKKITPKKRFLIIFLLLNFLLSIFFLDKGSNWNSVSRALPIMSYFEQGNFQLDKYKDLTGDISYIGGHYYTDKAPIATMIVLPFYKILVSTGIITRYNSAEDLPAIGILASLLIGSIPFLLLLFFMMKSIIDIKTSISPIILIMFSVYGSMLFVFSGVFFSHLLGGIFLLSAYLLLQKNKFLLAGLFTGLAFSTEFPLGVFLPIWTLIILLKEKSLKNTCAFILGAIPFVFFILCYNYYFTGSAFTMLYNFEALQGFKDEFSQPNTIFGFGIPRLENVWEMIFGQYKGLLFYMPILILIIMQIYKSIGKVKVVEIATSYFIIPSLAFVFIIVSKSYSWWGGWTYGPRYLIPVCVLFAYEGILFLAKLNFSKILFYCVTGFGLICAWMAKSTVVFGIPSEENYPVFGYVFSQFKNGNLNQNNLLTILFDIDAQHAAYIWVGLFVGSAVLLCYLYKKLVLSSSLLTTND